MEGGIFICLFIRSVMIFKPHLDAHYLILEMSHILQSSKWDKLNAISLINLLCALLKHLKKIHLVTQSAMN